MRLILLLAIYTLVGCGKTDEKPPVKLLEPQRQELQKAKQIEKTLQKAADAQRQAASAAGQ